MFFLDVHYLGLMMNTSEADEVHPVKDDLFHQSNLHLPRDVRNGFFLCEWLTLVIIFIVLVIFLDDLELMIWTRLWFELDSLPYLYLSRWDHDRSQNLCINTIFSGFSVWRGCEYHYKWSHIYRCNSWLHFYTM